MAHGHMGNTCGSLWKRRPPPSSTLPSSPVTYTTSMAYTSSSSTRLMNTAGWFMIKSPGPWSCPMIFRRSKWNHLVLGPLATSPENFSKICSQLFELQTNDGLIDWKIDSFASKSKIQWTQSQDALQTCRGRPLGEGFCEVIQIKGAGLSDRSKDKKFWWKATFCITTK